MKRRAVLATIGVGLSSGCLRLSDASSTTDASRSTSRRSETVSGTETTPTTAETTAAVTGIEVANEFSFSGWTLERRERTLYVLERGTLRSVDLETGETVGTVNAPESTPEHLVLDGEMAYCAGSVRDGRSTLAAVDLRSGVEWLYEGEYEDSRARPWRYGDQIAYASATTDASPEESGPQNRSQTTVLSAESGSVTWEPDQSQLNEETYVDGLAADSGTLIVFADSMHVYDLGTERHVGTAGLDCGFASPTVVDGRAYAGGTVAGCFDMETRETVWKTENPRPCRTPPVVADDVAYYPTDRGLSAHDRSDGSRRWFSTTMRNIYSGPVEVGGVLWVGCDDGVIYGFDAADGTQVAETSVEGPRIRSLVAFDGSIYAGSSRTVYELRPT